MIDLEAGRINGYEIAGLPLLPQQVIAAVHAAVEQRRNAALQAKDIPWRLCDEAHAIGTELDVLMPLGDDTWTEQFVRLAFMPPAKSIATSFGLITDQQRSHLTCFFD